MGVPRAALEAGHDPRLLIDLLCSQILLTFVTPWILALQSRALVLARVERPDFA